ncbi:MAG: hypothetical protein ACREE9_02665 [Stellaceae bacterium]
MAGDRDEPSALGEPRERRSDVAHRGLGKVALDLGRDREGRVHQHDAGAERGIEMIVDLFGVVPADRDIAEQAPEKTGAGLGDLVQGQARFGDFGEDREQPGAGGGFEHEVGCGHRGGFGGDKAERDWRRELLEALGFLRAPRLRWQPPAEAGQHLEHRCGGAGARAHRRAEFAQEQDLRGFERFVGVLPHPRPFGIGAAEGRLHRRAQGAAVERPALPQQLRQQRRGMKKPRDPVGRGLGQKQRQGGRDGRCR